MIDIILHVVVVSGRKYNIWGAKKFLKKSSKKVKKVLDKGLEVWYSIRADPRARAQRKASRTLKTIQRRNAQSGDREVIEEEEDSEDSKRVESGSGAGGMEGREAGSETGSVEGSRIKRKSLILAQDERWRRA